MDSKNLIAIIFIIVINFVYECKRLTESKRDFKMFQPKFRPNLCCIESWPREDFALLSEPFKTEGFSRLYKLAPIRETYQVDLNWALPPLQSQYRKKPLHYLSWVIGHEGKGSLISYLRKKG